MAHWLHFHNDRALLVPCLMIIVAAVQMTLVHNHDLSPWKGGGFGMFSTVDSPAARFLRIYLNEDQNEIPVPIPESLQKQALQYATFPTTTRLEELAFQIAKRDWEYIEMESAVHRYVSNLEKPFPKQDSSNVNDVVDFKKLQFVQALELGAAPLNQDRQVKFTSVRMEMWKYRFDGRTGTISAQLAAAITVKRPIP